MITSDKNEEYLLDWFIANSNKLRPEALACIAVLLLIYQLGLNQAWNGIIQSWGYSLCWSEFWLIHIIIILFACLHTVRIFKEIKLLKPKPSQWAELISYINEELDEKSVFGTKIYKRKKRKTIVVFVIVIICLLIPLEFLSWKFFFNSCSVLNGTFNSPMSTFGLICYSAILVAIPYYMIALIKLKV